MGASTVHTLAVASASGSEAATAEEASTARGKGRKELAGAVARTDAQ